MSSPDEIAISIKGVSKNFKLPHQKADSIKSLFINPLAIFGKKQQVEVQHALKDISFDIKKGEFFGIVGRNGSGKSTLLKILAGIYQPTEGSVSVEGKLVPFIELGVGFNPELTGRENVYLSCALNGFSEKETSEMYDDIVDFAELEPFMDQKLKNYSSGMQVRLAFSVATRSKADVLLIDEVLAVGDADFQRKCFNYFKELKRNKKTVVFVSHDMEAVREYCDRAALIDRNQLASVSRADVIAEEYAKLFTDIDMNSKTNEGSRWGSGLIKTASLTVETSKEVVRIVQVIRANGAISNPVIGVRVRTSSGELVTGTNTRIEHIKTGSMNDGESRKIEWSIQNIFSDGKYYVDPAILEEDLITVCDWWDEAESFIVNKKRRLPYPVDPGFDVEMV
jgi:ABC-2 type transport system ATP-binding protein